MTKILKGLFRAFEFRISNLFRISCFRFRIYKVNDYLNNRLSILVVSHKETM